VSRVPDIGKERCWAGARPVGVSGLRYLPAVLSPFPDTFIGTNDAGETVGQMDSQDRCPGSQYRHCPHGVLQLDFCLV